MSSALELLTPTYRPDLGLCEDLVASARVMGDRPRHRIVVPRRDLALARHWEDDRTIVATAESFLPSWLIKLPHNVWVDAARPWWPVRGWIVQQIIKLEATARSEADLVVVVDSDLVFARPFDAETFRDDGRTQFYRLPGGVHDAMPRHLAWHRVARTLLGLPAEVRAPLPDYICWPCAWDPSIVRDMLARIQAVHGKPWQRLVARERHFSEMILYGVYVDEVLGAGSPTHATTEMRCRRHCDETPLDRPALEDFVGGRDPDDVAVMISAKSGTDLDERRRVLHSAALLPL